MLLSFSPNRFPQTADPSPRVPRSDVLADDDPSISSRAILKSTNPIVDDKIRPSATPARSPLMRPFVKIDSRLPSTRAKVTRARKMLDRADPRDLHEEEIPTIPSAACDAWPESSAETIDYTCLFMWRARWSLREKHRSQCRHLNGFAPVCLR